MTSELDVRVNCVGLRTKMHEFRIEDKFTDVKIKCRNKVFKCHRLVLAAISEYFDKIFYGSSVEERHTIPLVGIDPTTFQQVLQYVYKDDVLINDKNVYSLLCASEMLQIDCLENRCLRFLRERNIPVNYALKIFSFARAKAKHALVSSVSRFILDNLEHFIHRSEFLQMHQDEFKVLLSYFQPSIVKEFDLAWGVFCWISHQSGTGRYTRFDIFIELTQNIEFQLRTAEEYFDECCQRDMFIAKWIRSTNANDRPTPSSCNKQKFSLHVFVNYDFGTRTSLFTLQKSEIYGLIGREYNVEGLDYDFMRTVSVGDDVYSLSLLWDRVESGTSLTFCKYRSVDYPSTSFRSIPMPQFLDMNSIFYKFHDAYNRLYYNPDSYNLCCDRNAIYLGFPNYKTGNRYLLNYDRITNRLTPLPNTDERLIPNESMMVCDESRLYLIGFRSRREKSRHVRAYDYRVGKWDVLFGNEIFDRNSDEWRDECCVHKGKIFSSSLSVAACGSLEIFDPVARKWDTNAVELKSKMSGVTSHRLLSYDGELWLFGLSDECNRICIQKYDSLSRESSGSYFLLDDAMMNRAFGTYWLLDAVVLNSYFSQNHKYSRILHRP